MRTPTPTALTTTPPRERTAATAQVDPRVPCTCADGVRQLVDHVAHPSVRDGLVEAAVRLGLPLDDGRSGGAASRGAGPSA